MRKYPELFWFAPRGRPCRCTSQRSSGSRAGMESNAFWMTDGTGMEMAFDGLNVGLRNLARLGRLFLNRGKPNGLQTCPLSQ